MLQPGLMGLMQFFIFEALGVYKPLCLNPTATKILFVAATLNEHDSGTKRLK